MVGWWGFFSSPFVNNVDERLDAAGVRGWMTGVDVRESSLVLYSLSKTLSACLPVVFPRLSIYLSIYLSVCLSVCVSTCLPISIFLTVKLDIDWRDMSRCCYCLCHCVPGNNFTKLFLRSKITYYISCPSWSQQAARRASRQKRYELSPPPFSRLLSVRVVKKGKKRKGERVYRRRGKGGSYSSLYYLFENCT